MTLFEEKTVHMHLFRNEDNTNPLLGLNTIKLLITKILSKI